MILSNYMYTAPEFFTREEVAQIHKHAVKVPLDTAKTGYGGMDDPDAPPIEENHSAISGIRQSKVKWFTAPGEYAMPENIVSKINDIVHQGMQACDWNFTLSWVENFQYTIELIFRVLSPIRLKNIGTSQKM